MVCHKCGTALDSDSVFCINCGEKMVEESTESFPQINYKGSNTHQPVSKNKKGNSSEWFLQHGKVLNVVSDLLMLIATPVLVLLAMFAEIFGGYLGFVPMLLLGVILYFCYKSRSVLAKNYANPEKNSVRYCINCHTRVPHSMGKCTSCGKIYGKRMKVRKAISYILFAAYIILMIGVVYNLIQDPTDLVDLDDIVFLWILEIAVYTICVILYFITISPWLLLSFTKIGATVVPIIIIANDDDIDAFVIAELILLLLLILISIYLVIEDSSLRKKKIHYCRRCKDYTRHNTFGVCTVCYTDKRVMLGCNIFCSIFAGILLGYSSASEHYGLLWIVSVIMLLSIFYKIYMYPAIMARRTEQAAATPIYWLNLLFGFTGIMWLILLIWGSSGRGFGTAKTEISINGVDLSQLVSQNNNNNTQVSQKSAVQQSAPVKPVATVGSFEDLKKLHEMGMLNDEEFEAKRKELISRL